MVAFGLTAMTGTPAVTTDLTVQDAAGRLGGHGRVPGAGSPASTSIASPTQPESSRSAKGAPISLPSALRRQQHRGRVHRAPQPARQSVPGHRPSAPRGVLDRGSGTTSTFGGHRIRTVPTGPRRLRTPPRSASGCLQASAVQAWACGAEPSTASTTTRTTGDLSPSRLDRLDWAGLRQPRWNQGYLRIRLVKRWAARKWPAPGRVAVVLDHLPGRPRRAPGSRQYRGARTGQAYERGIDVQIGQAPGLDRLLLAAMIPLKDRYLASPVRSVTLTTAASARSPFRNWCQSRGGSPPRRR